MKRIAVTYENGEVFQHFGHTEESRLGELKAEFVNETVIEKFVSEG